MNHKNLTPIFKLNNQLSQIEKVSLANLIAFPNDVAQDLYDDIFNTNENTAIGMIVLSTGFIIGGFVIKIIPGYQSIALKEIIINPKLKSPKHTSRMIDFLGDYGLEIFGENFKGIFTTTLCNKNKKDLNNKNFVKRKSMLNSGAITVKECARVKNNFMHFIYIPFNGGHESDEVKEIFWQIAKS